MRPTVFLATLLLLAGSALAQEKTKPDIVVMMADNLGYGDLGCYGGGETRGMPTPRIDSLAQEGLQLAPLDAEIDAYLNLAADQAGGATEGLLPVPGYAGDWRTRPKLSGDWGGARTRWANNGVQFDFRWFQVGQGVVDGGNDERWAYGTNLDYFIKLDLMRMGVLPGALVTFRAESRFGKTVNGASGLLMPVNTNSYFPYTSTLDDDVPFAITELNYTQFVSEKVGFFLGKITTMANSSEFAGGEGRDQFMNYQFIFPTVLAQVAPYSALAVGGVYMPTPKITVTMILMNTTDASTTAGFSDIGDGTTWWTSADYQYRAGRLPGGGTIGFAYAFDGDFGRIGGINIDADQNVSIDKKSSAWALYWSGWQYLYVHGESPELVDSGNGKQDLEGLGVFLILGLADESTNPVSFSVAAGLSGRGMIPGRNNDTYGLGYFYNDVQDPALEALDPLRGSTQGIEAYYNFAIAQSIALTFDLQWTRSALPVDDAIIVAFRLDIRF